jgi:hypothetical protein
MQPLDITDQIREHAEQLDAESSPVLFTELRGPKTVPLTDADSYTTRPLRGWMVAATSAVAVLVLVGGSIALVTLVAGGSEPDAATVATTLTTTVDTTVETPSTTAGVSPTTVAPPVASPVAPPTVPPETPPTSWTRIDTEMAPVSAAAGPAGLLAIEIPEGRDSDGSALLWSSIDGITWGIQPWGIPANGDPGAPSVETITHAGSRYFAFGGHWGIELRSSTDGVDWVAAEYIDAGTFEETVPLDSIPGTYGRIRQIAYGNGMYVSVGDVRDHEGEFYSNPRAAVWTSVDGLTWTRLPDNDEVFAGRWHQEMWDVAFGDSGFVAVGSSDGDQGDSSAGAIWHSPDGFTWTRVAHDDDLFGEQTPDKWWGLWSVAYGDGVYVAIGSGPRVLTSEDGLTWSLMPGDGLSADPGLVDVAFGDGSFVLVGNDWTPPEQDGDGWVFVPAIWYSTDAITWTRVSGDNDLFGGPFTGEEWGAPMTATFGDGRFFVVGYDQTWGDSGPSIKSGYVWIGEPAP